MRKIIFVLLCLVSTTTFAQRAGSLDTTFNHTGIVYNGITGDIVNEFDAMAIQHDQKIVAVGYTENHIDSISHGIVERYNTDGSIDTSFNKTGINILTLDSNIATNFKAVAIQSDGKILALGNKYPPFGVFILVQFNVNGTIDTTFGNKGIALTSVRGTATSLVIQADGKIVAGGYVEGGIGGDYFEIVRCNKDGKIDSTYGNYGFAAFSAPFYYSSYLQALTLQPNGKIVAAGYYFSNDSLIERFTVSRYNTDGSLDKAFGWNGMDTTYFKGGINSIAIQPDGKIVAAGTLNHPNQNNYPSFAITRYNANGSFDNTFGTNGFDTIADFGSDLSVLLQPDGKIVAGGVDPYVGFALFRFNSNGILDTSFGSGGNVQTPISSTLYNGVTSVALQANGKIVATGFASDSFQYSNYFALTRYNNDISAGVLHLTNSTTNIISYPNPVNNIETLDYTLTNNETLSIILYNVTGRVIQTIINSQQQLTGNHKQQLNFEGLAAGTYIITIRNSSAETESIKIIKQ